jgi:hypothetical protein
VNHNSEISKTEKSYRALISVPISAEDDEEAYERASEFANSLRHPGSETIAGHIELLIEAYKDSLTSKRVIIEDHRLWDQIRQTREFFAYQFGQDFGNDPFTNAELSQISEQLKQIQAYVRDARELSSEQAARVEDQFDQVRQASRRMGRKDWLSLFYGTLFSLILADIITPQLAQNILLFAFHGLSHLFGIGASPPPYLPSPK